VNQLELADWSRPSNISSRVFITIPSVSNSTVERSLDKPHQDKVENMLGRELKDATKLSKPRRGGQTYVAEDTHRPEHPTV